jgi:hypothetical protein
VRNPRRQCIRPAGLRLRLGETEQFTGAASPLAGSAHWLVYQQTPAKVVEARSVTGKTITVTRKRSADGKWSIAGNILTAGHGYLSTKVDWWNLSTGTHGMVILNSRAGYESAAPGGLLFHSAHGHLDTLAVPSGHVTRIDTHPAYGAVAGPRGFLVTWDGEARWAYIA